MTNARISDSPAAWTVAGLHFSFRQPRQSRLLLFDSELPKQYSRVLLDRFEHVRIDPRPGRRGSTVYLSPMIALRVLRRMLRRRSGDSRWGWKKKLAYCYFGALLESVGPCAVLSLRGGFTIWFSELAREFDSVEFLAVASAQVHTAHLRILRPSPAHYFVYGEFDRKQLARTGQPAQYIHTVGPLLGGYFQHVGWTAATPRYDLCIPSQVVELALENSARARASDRPTLIYVQQRLAEFTSRFARERGLRVAIALRPQEPSSAPGGERRFFERHMDCEYEIIESRPEAFSSYHAIAASRVVVTHCSTTGFEVLSWPKKVLFCELRPYEPYRLSNRLPWTVRTDDYATFERTLQLLLDRDDAEYAAEMESAVRYFNGYRASAPPHAVLADRLRRSTSESSQAPGKLNRTRAGTSAGQSAADIVQR